jgi:P27 family predicted phage terminase small subunit
MVKKNVPSIDIPVGLSKDQIAEFHRLTRAMGDVKLFECDAAAVIGYLDAWALTREASAHLRTDGATIRTPNGSVQVSPWHSIHKAQSLLLIRWVRELGISPSSRNRLGIGPPSDDSDLTWDSADMEPKPTTRASGQELLGPTPNPVKGPQPRRRRVE